jgi:hypothetical protein
MAGDVITLSNPLVALVDKAPLEEAPLEVNVSQWSRKEEPSKKVVHT